MNRPLGWCWSAPREYLDGRTWIMQQELELLKPDHWMDWSYYPSVLSPVYTPMLWTGYDSGVKGVASYLENSIAGETVLLWNEPERPGQADMSPEIAFRWTQTFLRTMWDTGVEFQWAAPGASINMRDYDGLEWLTEYTRLLRRHGISRPSYWHIHSYHSNTEEQLHAAWSKWQDWYTDWGGNAPVVLSEVCAANMPDQRPVMDECRELLSRGDVVGVYWFATHPTSVMDWPNAYLCKMDAEGANMELTPLGEHWIGLK